MKRCGRLDEQLEAIAMISKSWKLHSMSGDRQHYFQLSDMLRRFADYKCSDPRDCRHALHNMATDLERSKSIAGPNYMLPRIPFAVDYSLNMKDTYHAFAFACVRAGRIKQLLQAVAEHASSDVSPDRTSWVRVQILITHNALTDRQVPDCQLMPMPRKSWSPERGC
ncbi:uncharacterized protein CC84DRAFT_365241 [Paraphaeosphaeria sporulosa]|uniref:Uncharacterized protein n=1 Tax=Paraphaeosphaeria sporulosa TaxID=1460663 RepID=A0A177BVQ8_9PLEO|nr:uncharacterized protein CC84DRAFT_365241 [Paraphaeosphaeria sporulosa]OAF99573.1 hypothetical protein CC84DRAFT_365241 [Paraphaeosphaeria sporulosa]